METNNQRRQPGGCESGREDDLFRRCRGIPAAEAAQWLGMEVSGGRGRRWALCPLHGDSRPSLMFDTRGRWHCFGCGRGEVLYLDLESRQYRVQERLSALRKGPPPEGLYIAHRAPRLDGGLLDALGAWVKAHPDTALIIVDTLARIKCPGQGGENAYEADTRILGAVQRFALDHGLCVLLVHHLRKSVGGVKEQDVYERVSGSTGLTGVCDCVLVLDGKRQETEAQLYVDGRDIPPAQLALGFDQGRWTLLSEDGAAYQSGTAYEQSPLPAALKRLMEGKDRWEGRPHELVEAIEALSDGQANSTSRDIFRAIKALMPELAKREGISAQSLYRNGTRYIRLRRESGPAADARGQEGGAQV